MFYELDDDKAFIAGAARAHHKLFPLAAISESNSRFLASIGTVVLRNGQNHDLASYKLDLGRAYRPRGLALLAKTTTETRAELRREPSAGAIPAETVRSLARLEIIDVGAYTAQLKARVQEFLAMANQAEIESPALAALNVAKADALGALVAWILALGRVHTKSFAEFEELSNGTQDPEVGRAGEKVQDIPP